MAIKKGTIVQQVVNAPIQGTVDDYAVDRQTGEVTLLVGWTDGAGQRHERHFKESEVSIAQA